MAQSPSRTDLTAGPVGPLLARLTLPMVVGVVAVTLFNIVDTWFIGQLGAEPLAAMAFTFPVTYVITNITMGIGVGASAVIARAIGEQQPERVRRLTTHALLLAVALVTSLSVIGLLTIDPLFLALGADPEMLPLIGEYMRTIYLGLGFLVVPMVGNAAIRATGDTKTPSYIMICAGGVNLVLDPLLIFGLGPFPRLELFGGALATVLAWAITFCAALWVLHRRERMLAFEWPRLATLWASWKAILYVGLPAAGTFLLVPVANGVLTRMVSDHGTAAVAGFGVGGRIEALAMVAIFALGSGLAPFVGQNFGARACGRIREAVRLSVRFALVYGLGMAGLLALAGPSIGAFFADESRVVEVTAHYLWIVPLSYAAFGVAIVANSTFNALNRPLHSGAVIVVRLFVLAVPLALLGDWLYGVEGIFGGLAAGNLIGGGLAFVLLSRVVGRFGQLESAAAVAEPEPEAPAAPMPTS